MIACGPGGDARRRGTECASLLLGPARPGRTGETRAARGGAWFALPDGRQLHLGVEDPFLPSKKGYPALVVSSLDELAHKLEAAGLAVRWDDELAPRRRFYGEDPFGNRLEFLEPEALRL